MTIALNSALSGLKAAQNALNTVSSNIANASTPGYTRKIIAQETLIVGGIAQGASSSNISRIVDRSLLRDVVAQLSVSQGASIRNTYLERLQDFHGSSDSQSSIAAQLGRLQNTFASLSNTPESGLALAQTLTAAQQTATKFNNLSKLLTQMRNDVQKDISDRVGKVNLALDKIADLNTRISNLSSGGQTTAELEDQRDLALRELSTYIQVNSFIDGNDRMIVMTTGGDTLIDAAPRHLVFSNTPLGPAVYYPGGNASGLYLESTSGADIAGDNVGGEIGALLTLRDETMTSYQAQLDELAQKMSMRFDQQGLTLFTDQNGSVPADTPGDYVGYAAVMQVNTDIVNDPTLLRSGTYGQSVLDGSNETIRKISEFAFGVYKYFEATGTTDISSVAGNLHVMLGISEEAQVIGDINLNQFSPSLDTNPDIVPPATFNLSINGNNQVISILAGHSAQDFVNTINTAFGSNVARINGLGQLVVEGDGDITIADGGIGAAGIAALGLEFGTTTATDPNFIIQVGRQTPVTVSIADGDTYVELLATLNAIDGITASVDPGTGGLVITPTLGGDITLNDGVGRPLSTLGMTLAGVAHDPFHQTGLGPGGDQVTNLVANAALGDYTRSMVASQSEDSANAAAASDREKSFFNLLDTRQQNQSGVDIDKEVAELVRIQSAYTAAARMITVTEKMLDEFFNSVT